MEHALNTGSGFKEATGVRKVEAVPLAHVSVEVGHLYVDDFEGGLPALTEHFRQVAPWLRTMEEVCAASLAPRTPRISTCFLIDDYFTPFSSPLKVVPELLKAASEVDVRIDYIARESACAEMDGVDVARLVEAKIVPEPAPGTTGGRPPVTETGWLSNGLRSPTGTPEAMAVTHTWRPPREIAANRHSIFVDVELWDEDQERRVWSCPYLAAIWQLLRLGMLRDNGRVVGAPQAGEQPFASEWSHLPPVIAVNAAAAPFWAYRTMSVLGTRFLGIEHAVRTILSQVNVDSLVSDQVLERARREGLAVPPEIVERIEYVFAGRPWS